jgi:O-antigen/teichoic acid export membrane protein
MKIKISILNIVKGIRISPEMKALAIKSLPLGVAGSLVSLNSNLPRYLVDKLLTSEDLGIYIGISYFMVGAATVTVAIKQAVISRLAKYWHTNRQLFYKFIFQLNALVFIVGGSSIFITFIFGDEILNLIYGKAFEGNRVLIALMFSAASFMAIYSFFNASLTIIRALKIQALISLISILFSFGFGYYLIPKMGLIGAGITVNIASMVFALGSVIAFIYVIKKEGQSS